LARVPPRGLAVSRQTEDYPALTTPEFIRRCLIHVLPDGFHRIRHYGLLASSTRKTNITRTRLRMDRVDMLYMHR
jgi:hypothetical protein